MAGDPAELAYGHALAMLGNPDAAAVVAELALRRAGRSRGQVLAHARAESVLRAAADEPVDIESLQTVVLDLPALAATLASTRPATERAALDIRARTSGDLVALGDALGMRPSDAADRCAEIAELWERTLDPALLAFSGAGECEALATVLDRAAPDTVAKLLEVASAVHAHVADCLVCTDRVRAMAPVRSFFSDATVEVPESVREASSRDRTKRPSAPPAPLFAEHAEGRRLPLALRWAAVAVVVGGAILVGVANRDTAKPDTALTKVAVATGLRLESQTATGLTLRNTTDKALRYTLSASTDWLRLSPAEGRIPAGASMPIVATITDDAPEGAPRATVIAHTSSGATLSQEFVWHNERAPELATTLEGCAVGVSVVDDGDLSSLELHWRDTAEHVLDIANDADRYSAELRPDNGPVTYWVTASDSRGNASRTADAVF
jgi:hypothetical protein